MYRPPPSTVFGAGVALVGAGMATGVAWYNNSRPLVLGCVSILLLLFGVVVCVFSGRLGHEEAKGVLAGGKGGGGAGAGGGAGGGQRGGAGGDGGKGGSARPAMSPTGSVIEEHEGAQGGRGGFGGGGGGGAGPGPWGGPGGDGGDGLRDDEGGFVGGGGGGGGGFDLDKYLRSQGIDPDDPTIKWHGPKL